MKEQEYLEARQKRVNDFEEQIHQVRLQDAEEYQQVKIKLETEVQVTSLLFCQFCSVPTFFHIKLEISSNIYSCRE